MRFTSSLSSFIVIGLCASTNIRGPAWFRCETPELEPSWGAFRKLFNAYVSSGRRLSAWGLDQLLGNATSILNDAEGSQEDRFDNIGRLALNFIKNGEEDNIVPDQCLFAPAAALYAFYMIVGHRAPYYASWQEDLLRALSPIAYIMRESGWLFPSYSAIQKQLSRSPRKLQVGLSYRELIGLGSSFWRPAIAQNLRRRINTVVICAHVSQTIQTSNMLKDFAQEHEINIKIKYAGGVYPKVRVKALGGDPDSLLSQALAKWASGAWGFGSLSDSESQAAASEISVGLLAEDIPSYDLAVVFGPGTPVLVRELSARIRILEVIGCYPLAGFYLSRLQQELRDAMEKPRTSIFATSAVAAVQMFYLSGVRLPVITPLPDHLPMYAPDVANPWHYLLQWRGDVMWNTVAGSMFAVWIMLLFDQNTFNWKVSSMTHGLTLAGMGWDEIVRHDAVLFVPEDSTKIAFWDLYSTSIPLFVADAGVVAHIVCPEPSSLHKNHYFDSRLRGPFFQTGVFEDLEPFELAQNCAGKLELWLPYCDYYNFPSITIFNSGIDLLNKIRSTDLQAISLSMRAARANKLAQSKTDFARALAPLLSPVNRSKVHANGAVCG